MVQMDWLDLPGMCFQLCLHPTDTFTVKYMYEQLLINDCYIYINKMKTAFVIQIVQLGQYRTKLPNTDFFLVLADFDPANIGVPDSL